MKIRETLAKYTTLGLGGPADYLIDVEDINGLKKVLEFSKKQKLPLTLLGGGSNVLVKDGGIRGLVVRLKEDFSGVKINGTKIRCGAGAPLSGVLIAAAAKGLTGLEFAAGIPGTVGGAAIMNAGANGKELKDVVSAVTVIDKNGKIKKLTPAECGFTYRSSKLKGGRMVVIEAVFKLEKSTKERVKAKILALLRKRKMGQPCSFGTAGCIFKNPRGLAAGQLIDSCDLKGKKVGKAFVSRQHANYLMNRGSSARDFLKLMELVKKTVFAKKGVRLEEEIMVLGEDR